MWFCLIVSAFVAAVGIPTIAWTMWNQKRVNAEHQLTQGAFARETGFTRLPPDPAGDRHETRYEKSHPLGTMRYLQRAATDGTVTRGEGHWRLDRATLGRMSAQIAEHTIAPRGAVANIGKAAADSLLGSRRIWKQLFPGPVSLGTPELDGRYYGFTDQPAALATLVNDAELMRLLAPCPEVDLCITPDAIVFTDPARLNLGALMVAVGSAPSAIPGWPNIAAHLHVMRILERVAELTA